MPSWFVSDTDHRYSQSAKDYRPATASANNKFFFCHLQLNTAKSSTFKNIQKLLTELRNYYALKLTTSHNK